MAATVEQRSRTPKFTGERSLYAARATYRSRASAHSHDDPSGVVPQLGRGLGGFGAADSCDGCATFNYATCVNDCGGDADCRADCLARAFECDLCRIDVSFGIGGVLM
jgi:hypothetical protein